VVEADWEELDDVVTLASYRCWLDASRSNGLLGGPFCMRLQFVVAGRSGEVIRGDRSDESVPSILMLQIGSSLPLPTALSTLPATPRPELKLLILKGFYKIYPAIVLSQPTAVLNCRRISGNPDWDLPHRRAWSSSDSAD
jgi:hypothetical protein